MLAILDEGEMATRFRPHFDDPEFGIFDRAPAPLVITAQTQGPWIVEDCARPANA